MVWKVEKHRNFQGGENENEKVLLLPFSPSFLLLLLIF